MADITNEERLEIENKQLRASIEIYAQQCMELARFARKFEQLENKMDELHSLLSRVSILEGCSLNARLSVLEDRLNGEFDDKE